MGQWFSELKLPIDTLTNYILRSNTQIFQDKTGV